MRSASRVRLRAQVVEREFLRHLFLHQRVGALQSGDIGVGPARHGRGRRPQCPQLFRQQAEHADMHSQRVRRAQQRARVQGGSGCGGRMRQRLFADQHAQLRHPLMRLETALAANGAKRRHRRMPSPEMQLPAIARGVAGRAFQADGNGQAARIVMLRLLDERQARAVIGMHEQQALVDLTLVGAALFQPRVQLAGLARLRFRLAGNGGRGRREHRPCAII